VRTKELMAEHRWRTEKVPNMISPDHEPGSDGLPEGITQHSLDVTLPPRCQDILACSEVIARVKAKSIERRLRAGGDATGGSFR
jgi:hypothetical protein